ncbi:MAG: DoxX family protein [Polyangiales bacterium]
MNTIVSVAQVVVALAILNVWILRFGKATSWRGGEATNMREEFTVYGLPDWFMFAIGFLKISLSALLIVGLWVPALTKPAATGMALLMIGAIAMHFKAGDAPLKSLPAFVVLSLCALIALA